MPNTSGFAPSLFRRAFLSLSALALLAAPACGPSDSGIDTYLVTFTLSDSPDDLESLSFRVVYNGGEIRGSGSAATCILADDEDRTASFEDDDDDTLEVEIDAVDAPLEPLEDLVHCQFEGATQPSAFNFAITVTDAEGVDEDVNLADVDVVVTSTDPAGTTSEAAE